MTARQINVEEFHAELKAQGMEPDRQHLAFICPMCRTIQSGQSLIDAGAGETFDAVEKYLGFCCIGRFTNAGPPSNGAPAKGSIGCNWTLGGFFRLHELEVLTPDGKAHPRFEVASPGQAQQLRREPLRVAG